VPDLPLTLPDDGSDLLRVVEEQARRVASGLDREDIGELWRTAVAAVGSSGLATPRHRLAALALAVGLLRVAAQADGGNG
jgi:hypothetical protein